MQQNSRVILFVLAALARFSQPVSAQANSSRVVDVFLIGGQSNATGQGYRANLPACTFIDTTVLLFHSGLPHLNSGGPANSWQPLRQASETPDRFGPELGFGTRLHQLMRGKTIALIKHAHSGTNLFYDWGPGEDAADTAHWGEQFKIFIQTVQLAMDALRQKGYTPVIRGMIWQQGESDADKTDEISRQYGAHLAAFIRRVREQLQAPGMLFIYGYVLPPPVVYAGGAEVRKGQYLVSQDSGDTLSVKGAFVVPTDDLSHRAHDRNTHYPNDHLHFGTEGIWQLGIRMADKMNAAMGGSL